MNIRIISFICAGLVATSCVSSLCFYDYFANDGTTSNPIYWIFDFFQLSILLGQAGIGVYTINVLLRQRKEAISSLGYFAAHVFLQNITPLLQAWSAAVITEYPLWLLISQVSFSIALFTALFIQEVWIYPPAVDGCILYQLRIYGTYRHRINYYLVMIAYKQNPAQHLPNE